MPELTAPDGRPLAYDAYLPGAEATPRGVLLWACGWSDHRGRWAAPARALRDAGYAVYVFDQRGQGDSGGVRGHLSRFSQLLGDVQAFRRLARQRHPAAPHVLLGHGFGGLVVLRYLETQPSDPVAATVLASPWLAAARPPGWWRRIATPLLADLWPTLPFSSDVGAALAPRDALRVTDVVTAGAWREIRWAQHVVPVDAGRVECPLLVLLGDDDRLADAARTRALVQAIPSLARLLAFPGMGHALLNEPGAERVVGEIVEFLRQNAE